jgi:tetratricopeptide (TPR) repeat protein
VLVTFHKWPEILTYPDHFKGMTIAPAFRHFARGLAYADIGRIHTAKKQLEKIKKFKSKLPTDAMVGLNSAWTVLEIAADMLDGVIEVADGEMKDGVALLRKAVQKEDALSYDEPPDWYPSVRWTLGAVLYSSRDYAGAEKVFREDLKKYPHNGRGLFGLYNSLKTQGKNDEASKVEMEFKEAWKHADVKLMIEDLW